MTTKINLPTDNDYILIVGDLAFAKALDEIITSEIFYHTVVVGNAYQAFCMVEASKPALIVSGFDIPFDCFRMPTVNAIHLYDVLHQLEGEEDVPTIIVSLFSQDRAAAANHKIPCCTMDIAILLQLIKKYLQAHVSLSEVAA